MTTTLRPSQLLRPFSFHLKPPASRAGQLFHHGLQRNQRWVRGLLLLALCCGGGAQAAPLSEQGGGEAEALALQECGLGDFAAAEADSLLNRATHAALVSAMLESLRELERDPLEPATRARVLQALVGEFHFFTSVGNPPEARAARTPKIAVFAAEFPPSEKERVLFALSRLERDLAPPQQPEGDRDLQQNSTRPTHLLVETILRHFIQAALQTRGPGILKFLQVRWLQDRPEVLKRLLQGALQDAVIRRSTNPEDPQLADLLRTLPASEPGFDAAAPGDLLRHPHFLAATLKERLAAWFSPTTPSSEAERHGEFCRVFIQHLPQMVHESKQASSVYRQGQQFVERLVQNSLPDGRALSSEQRTLWRALKMKVGAYRYFGTLTFSQDPSELPPPPTQGSVGGGSELHQAQEEQAFANQPERHVRFYAPSSLQARQASTSDLPAASASLPPPQLPSPHAPPRLGFKVLLQPPTAETPVHSRDKGTRKIGEDRAARPQDSPGAGPAGSVREEFVQEEREEDEKLQVGESQFLLKLNLHHKVGLYAKVPIPEGALLGYYRGKTFPDLEARSEALRGLSYPQRKRSRLDRHLLYVGNPDHQPAPGARQQSLFLIDALMVGEKSSRRSLLSYINHDTQEDNSVRRVRHVEDSEKNRVLFPEGYSVGIYAKRAIFAGEEILINYGDSCHQTLLKTYREYRDFVNDRELEQDGTRARRLTASQRRQPARRATGGQAREAQAGGETFRTEARTKARAEDPMDDQAQEAALLDFILSQNAQSQGQAQAQQQQPTAAAGPDQRAVSKAPELPALPLPSEPVPQQEQGDALMDYILSQIQ